MTDELTVCAAAFFRSIGKDVTTSDEFVMIASLELKWMSPSDAKLLLRTLLSEGVLEKKGEYIRPTQDLSGLDLPLAYKPSKDVLDRMQAKPAPAPATAPKKAEEPDMFHVLIGVAAENGIQTRDFVPACSKVQKRLGIDISAAALLVLRDKGVDISAYVDRVYEGIRSAQV
jgi:hypothetical protein